jgi:hypothetical protein
MRLRHAVLGGGITGFTRFGTDLSFAANASLQLRLDFITRALFERIRATERKQREDDSKEERPGPHRLILETNPVIANCQLPISN